MMLTAIRKSRRVMHRRPVRLMHIERNHDGSAFCGFQSEDGDAVWLTLSAGELELIQETPPGKRRNLELT